MNKKKESLNVLNKYFKKDKKNLKDYEKELSKMFEEELNNFEDAQETFNYMNHILKGSLDYFCYVLSDGGEWSVKAEGITKEHLLLLNECLDKTFNDTDDLISYLENKIYDTESNVGCDAYTALNLELNDFPEQLIDWNKYIYLYVPEGNPHIYFLE